MRSFLRLILMQPEYARVCRQCKALLYVDKPCGVREMDKHEEFLLDFTAGQRPHTVCPCGREYQVSHPEVSIPSAIHQRARADEPIVRSYSGNSRSLVQDILLWA